MIPVIAGVFLKMSQGKEPGDPPQSVVAASFRT